jgi:hypothetical protein
MIEKIEPMKSDPLFFAVSKAQMPCLSISLSLPNEKGFMLVNSFIGADLKQKVDAQISTGFMYNFTRKLKLG